MKTTLLMNLLSACVETRGHLTPDEMDQCLNTTAELLQLIFCEPKAKRGRKPKEAAPEPLQPSQAAMEQAPRIAAALGGTVESVVHLDAFEPNDPAHKAMVTKALGTYPKGRPPGPWIQRHAPALIKQLEGHKADDGVVQVIVHQYVDKNYPENV